MLAVGCYYAVREALGEQQSICERSFVSAFFCASIVHCFVFFSLQHNSSKWDFYNCSKFPSIFIILAQGLYMHVCEYTSGFKIILQSKNYKVIAEGKLRMNINGIIILMPGI